MMRGTRLTLLLAVALVAFVAAPALELHAENGEEAGNGEDAAAPEGRTADVIERALAFRDAYSARDADALWDLITESSRQGFEEDLSELQRAMRELPEERRDEVMPPLSVSPNDLIELRGGRDYFAWMLSEVDDEHLEQIGSLTLDAQGIRFDGDEEARLTWRAPEDADREARNLARDMPRTAVYENDRWHFVVTSD